MSDTSHRAFFGDAEHMFQLTAPMILELERVTGTGIGALFQRFANLTFTHADLVEVIRLGLVGAGTDPEQARRLVDAYAVPRPISEVRPLAWDILKALWFGPADQSPLTDEVAP